MLQQLKEFGIKEGYFEIRRIGDFERAAQEGFSHIDTAAIDFDKTKDKVCDELWLNALRSCDALDIIGNKNKINFIEFKQLEDRNNIEDWINKLELPQKIKDSRDVLLNVVRNRKFVFRNKVRLLNSSVKQVIISFELAARAKEKLATLMRWTTVKAGIEKQFCQNYIQGENFKDPVCIRMKEFDRKYQQYT